MDTAVVGLIGAAIGASGTLSVVLLTHYFTQRRESDRHARETVTVTVALDADRSTVPVLARTVTNAGFPATAKTHGG